MGYEDDETSQYVTSNAVTFSISSETKVVYKLQDLILMSDCLKFHIIFSKVFVAEYFKCENIGGIL